MREILFRGKRKDNGEWVEGYYIQKQNPHTVDGLPISHLIFDVYPFCRDVDPDTVGEYTGLTDKNGTMIFEGDILRGWDTYQDEYCIAGTVMYGEGQFDSDIYKYQGWYLRSGEDRRDDISQEAIEFFGYEVAGNVHDNPELLESGLTEEGPDR